MTKPTKTQTTQSTKDFHDGTTYKLWGPCLCGCGEVVRDRFAPGHDMRVQPRHGRKAAGGGK